MKNPFFGIFQQLVKLDAGAKPFVHAVLHVARADSGLTIGATAPAGTAPTPGVSRAFRAGGRVQGIKRLSGRMPAYPEKAAARGVQGVVVMYGTLRTDGTVDDIVVLESPDHELEEAAVEAWKTWKYEPMKLNGQPVECRELQRFEFQLR